MTAFTLLMVGALILRTSPAEGQLMLSVGSRTNHLTIYELRDSVVLSVIGPGNEEARQDSVRVVVAPATARAWVQASLAALRTCGTSRNSGPVTLEDWHADPPDADGSQFPRIFFHCGHALRRAWAAVEVGDASDHDISLPFHSLERARGFFRSVLHDRIDESSMKVNN